MAALEANGVDTVFGLPGVQLDPAFDALARRGAPRLYHTRHEQATSYMADGYARVSGRLGCCLVVPGPGLLNAMAGLATAYSCSSPVLCVTGQVRSDLIGSGLGLLHEVPNQLEMVRSVVKWAGRAMAPGEIPAVVAEAVRHLRSGRPRPAAIEIPPDVLEASCEEPPDLAVAADGRLGGDADQLEQAAALLHGAERPLIFAGGGVLRSGGWEELRELAERLGAPVLLTGQGKGALSARHPLAFEALAAANLVRGADVLLAVGTRFSTPSGTRWRLADGQRLVRIDADAGELARGGVRPEVAIEADARLALGLLGDLLPARRAAVWRGLDEVRDRARSALARLEPQASFGTAIREAVPDDTIVVHGITQVGYWCRAAFPVYEPRTFLGAGYQGTLGFELPTGLGAQVAAPGRRTVVIVGDGGLLFNVQELASAVQHGLGVVIVVFDDGAYGNVRRIQQQRFGGRLIASELHNPDFVRMAASFGVQAWRAAEPEALGAALRRAMDADGPVLIAVPVGEMADPWPVLMSARPI